MKPPVEPGLQPLTLEEIEEQTGNLRTALLELDSVYNLPAVRDPEPDGPGMKLGEVQPVGPSVPGKDEFHDLPRREQSNDPQLDREACIGDPRNDENLIVAQLHVAFLRAHNRLLDEAAPPNRFRKAKRRLRRHYQHIVLHDFLKQIADPVIVDDIIENGNRIYKPDEDELFMPLEYAVAAFRFGHSMIRAEYDYNLNFNTTRPETSRARIFPELFMFTALSGQMVGLPTLPQNWIIQWENFFEGGDFFNPARRIDTQIVEPLQHLQTMEGQTEAGLAANLAVRNLLRGYQLRMPTGQAVARALRKKLQGVRDIPVLTRQQIREAAASDKQRDVLERKLPENTTFLERTPLWYYILAEAAFLRRGRRLGPVGSTIVAEVLVGLVRRSPDSILAPGSTWEPNLPSPQRGRTLEDLLRFTGVLT
jgi:heme peroxidase